MAVKYADGKAFFIHCYEITDIQSGKVVEIHIPSCSMTLINNFVKDLQHKYNISNMRDIIHRDTGTRRKSQFCLGKIGEVAVARVIGGWVDFSIWDRGFTFDPDIEMPTHHYFTNMNIHVKTCNAKYVDKKHLTVSHNASWTLDKGDPIRRHPTENDIIFLMFANQSRAFLLGFLYANQILHLWKPCVDSRMNHKMAIYYNDIKKYIIHSISVLPSTQLLPDDVSTHETKRLSSEELDRISGDGINI